MLSSDELFSDITCELPLSPHWCQCYYDTHLKLLLVLSDAQQAPLWVKTVWLKILEACQLKDWVAAFSGKPHPSIIYHKILCHPQGIERLQRHFEVKHTWFIGPHPSWLAKDVLFTQGFREWDQDPSIKKQVWLKWLKFQK